MDRMGERREAGGCSEGGGRQESELRWWRGTCTTAREGGGEEMKQTGGRAVTDPTGFPGRSPPAGSVGPEGQRGRGQGPARVPQASPRHGRV